MTKILDWRKSDDPRDIVHLAVQALAEGHVIALPCSHSYILVANALHPGTVASLASLDAPVDASIGQIDSGLCLMVRHADETLDYFPDISAAARRLARKVWPSPVVLDIKDSHNSSVLQCLDSKVRSALQRPGGRIHVSKPSHLVLDHVCRLSSGPLVYRQAEGINHGIANTVENMNPNQSVLTIDAGCVESPGIPTVIQIDGKVGEIIQPGIVGEKDLRALTQWMVLFVCTGNTCRSPMAQALMQKKLLAKFGETASPGNVPVITASAGVSALGGDPASHGAVSAIRNFGTSLDKHVSTQLNSSLVEQADLILAMGNRHRHVIVSQWPSVASKVHLISPDGGEISDPFGGPIEIYEKCAKQLDEHTNYWIDRLDIESLIQWR